MFFLTHSEVDVSKLSCENQGGYYFAIMPDHGIFDAELYAEYAGIPRRDIDAESIARLQNRASELYDSSIAMVIDHDFRT